jgi:2-polyprenyl-3-methyl-5-hydroxy-6-metoxy-1,4-benzoquinol methylase
VPAGTGSNDGGESLVKSVTLCSDPGLKDESLLDKLQYLARSALRSLSPAARRCPNCGGDPAAEVDRKYLFTTLFRCSHCALLFRAPADSAEFNRFFYNHRYRQGMATASPSDEQIATLKRLNFAGSQCDFADYVTFLRRHGIAQGGRLFDFGCSWGYGSYQFAQAGYDVYAHEIALDRRTYAIAKLGIHHIDEPFEIKDGHPLANSFDCFFAAHVLEHVPSPSKVIDLAWHCLKDRGAFVAFSPNGCESFRRYNAQGWRTMWGNVHPNYLDDVFYDRSFSRSRHFYDSRDGSEPHKHYELGLVAIKDASSGGF